MALLSALTHTLTSRKLTALVVAVSLCALSAITFLPQEASAQSVSDLSPLCRAALDTTGNQINVHSRTQKRPVAARPFLSVSKIVFGFRSSVGSAHGS